MKNGIKFKQWKLWMTPLNPLEEDTREYIVKRGN